MGTLPGLQGVGHGLQCKAEGQETLAVTDNCTVIDLSNSPYYYTHLLTHAACPRYNALTTMPLLLPDLSTPLTHVECPHFNATAAAHYLTHQVQRASPQLIMLDYMSGWGVNGSLVTLLPDTPLPLLTPSPFPSMEASSSQGQGLSTEAMAGIVVGSIAGAAILTGAAALLWLHRCV